MIKPLQLLMLVGLVGMTAAAFGVDEKLEEGGVNPGYHPQPDWFKQSFLDLNEDVEDAVEEGKRLLLYFYQDGCPYCAKLLQDNFGQRVIAQKTQDSYEVVAINLWGDREVTNLEGEVVTEKQFAADLKVMFTPTLLFLDEQGGTALRVNGYYHPAKFISALEYASTDREADFSVFLAKQQQQGASETLNEAPFFQEPPFALARSESLPAERPLVVLFEQPRCAACDEFHQDVLTREEMPGFFRAFDVVQLDRWADTPVLTPDGERTTARQWADSMEVKYTPGMLFFDETGREVFRTEAYLKSFHVQSALEYVASGAYRDVPEFQRFVQARAERLEAEGGHVDIWD
ncbi:thioredoxin family protein [Thiohalomonas denitrificans]|uniref:Thioredoxin-related protein n=1 Tax=Thiohalomonas denitrificans TaxID=415747 RepID=A0A1G5PJ92_9GAMM|nr:thioredoxin fold domain-containing protein [Thiohalomonas denitrificans]SCZ49271.1 Thioredoxin-related protein [Thiohalomonas denitrificans]